MSLSSPLQSCIKTTPYFGELLEKAGLHTVQDLLLYFPRTYEDRSTFTTLAKAKVNDIATVRGKLYDIERIKTPKGHRLIKARFLDEEKGEAEVVWFNQQYLASQLKENIPVVLSGKLEYDYGKLSLRAPKHEFPSREGKLIHFGRIMPVYPEIDKLSSDWFRRKIHGVKNVIKEFPETLPWEIMERKHLMERKEAIREIHFPSTMETLERARKRLAFEEMYAIQHRQLQKRLAYQQEANGQGVAIPMDVELVKKFLSHLPFELTEHQRIATYQILKDMEESYPMLRLLEGDVGSGKTVVAMIAALHAVKTGNVQVAFMAPTEILASQHFKTMLPLLSEHGVHMHFLSGSSTKKQKDDVYKALANGTVDIVVGTHALIQEGVHFKKLGMVIIDEQHRFGVEQRKTLASQGYPHILHMTATPIPRTLALTMYGDQELSVISQMPKGRKPVLTRIAPPHERSKMYTFIDSHIEKGRQVFIVCPLVHESEKLEAVKAATAEFAELEQNIFPHRKVGLLHGQMKAKEKEEVMRAFKEKKYDILVATSVIEVGIDVPNASIMVIEGAERFGLSQLHQIRGRVGRGDTQSYCFLAIGKSYAEHTKRLKAMEKYHDGFLLSKIDLEMRGPGEVYGVRQSGLPDIKMADFSDTALIMEAREEAERILMGETGKEGGKQFQQKKQK